MTPEFYTYRTFLSIRNHFTKPDYDYFFYRGKTRTNDAKFKEHKNYESFLFLSQRVNLQCLPDFLAANFAYTRGAVWITDLLTIDANKCYEQFRKYIESSTYSFEEDMKKVGSLKAAITMGSGQYPQIIIDVLSGKIRIESLCILDSIYNSHLTEYFAAKINEPYLWPAFRLRYTKFTPFVKFNREKCKKVVDKTFKTK